MTPTLEYPCGCTFVWHVFSVGFDSRACWILQFICEKHQEDLVDQAVAK